MKLRSNHNTSHAAVLQLGHGNVKRRTFQNLLCIIKLMAHLNKRALFSPCLRLYKIFCLSKTKVDRCEENAYRAWRIKPNRQTLLSRGGWKPQHIIVWCFNPFKPYRSEALYFMSTYIIRLFHTLASVFSKRSLKTRFLIVTGENNVWGNKRNFPLQKVTSSIF